MKQSDGSELPTWLSVSGRTFSGTPAATDAGTLTIRITASDGAATDSADFTLTVVTSHTVPHNWSLKPSGLNAGDTFRLLFVTTGTTAGSSTSIATYNNHVRGEAGNSSVDAELRALRDHFTALASTAAVDARDNTATTGDRRAHLLAGRRQGGRQLRRPLRRLLGTPTSPGTAPGRPSAAT